MIETFTDFESVEMKIAKLSPEEREIALEGLDPRVLQQSWEYRARPDQLAATNSSAPVILFVGGRGVGKSATASEFVRNKILRNKTGHPLRFGLIGRTTADVSGTMIKGDSGIVSVFPNNQKPQFIGHLREVRFHDGSIATCFSSQEPDQLRGPQFHYAICDELASWDFSEDDSGLTAWKHVNIATRLGTAPQIYAATTPRRVKEIRELYKEAETSNKIHIVTGASTYDNPALSALYFENLTNTYEGTRLALQEIQGQMLGDVEGALWTLEQIEQQRLKPGQIPADLPLCVIGVDPSVAERPKDHCGIIVAKATGERDPLKRHAYVVADHSMLAAPSVWAKEVVKVARAYNAPVIAERNQGGALIKDILRTIDPTIRIRTVHARQGKEVRAEPVTLAYDQGRVSHVGDLAKLEDELTTWVRADGVSPDRLDACIAENMLIPTLDGLKRIDQVQPGDFTMTRKGWREILAVKYMGIKETLIVKTESGIQVEVTPDHRIWTENRGWINSVNLCCSDILLTWKNLIRDGKKLPGMASVGVDIPVMSSGHTESITSICDIENIYILPSGKKSTVSLHQKVSTFTTLILIHSIMSLLIWLRSTLQITGISMQIMNQDSWIGLVKKIGHHPLNQCVPGTEPKKDQSGILITLRSNGKLGIRKNLRRTVNNVIKNLKSLIYIPVDGVLKHAEQNGIENIILTIKSSSASNVEKIPGKDREQRLSNFVPEHVQALVAGESRKVYDLMVDGEHEFIANGILVHNCVYALSALVVSSSYRSGIAQSSIKSVARRSIDLGGRIVQGR